MCEPSTFVQGINTQRIVGNTIEQKIASFGRWEAQQRRGKNDMEQIPKHLERFIPSMQAA